MDWSKNEQYWPFAQYVPGDAVKKLVFRSYGVLGLSVLAVPYIL
jgi:hypothetical protein